MSHTCDAVLFDVREHLLAHMKHPTHTHMSDRHIPHIAHLTVSHAYHVRTIDRHKRLFGSHCGAD